MSIISGPIRQSTHDKKKPHVGRSTVGPGSARQAVPTLAITARAKELRAAGKDIIGLGAGEPDFDRPDHINEAAIKAIRDGFTKYTAVDGTPELKQAVIAKFARDNGFDYRANQILVSRGGKQSFYNVAQALLNPGDEVVNPARYWVSCPDMVLLAGGKPVIIESGIEERFKISPEQLERAITPATRLMVINSPSNPTGVAYTRTELETLGEVLRRHPEVVIASDDMYGHIIWGDEPFSNILNACPDLYDRVMVLNDVSKTCSMTGWRIGYARGPGPLIQAMKKVQSQSASNPTSVSQIAAQAALDGDQSCIRKMVAAFKRRHDFVVAELNQIPRLHCLSGDGTFYAFFSVERLIGRLDGIADDLELAEYLINEAGIAMVPGSAFGASGYMRLSFATSDDNLTRALERLRGVAGG